MLRCSRGDDRIKRRLLRPSEVAVAAPDANPPTRDARAVAEWSPPGKPGAPLPSSFDSLRSLRTTLRLGVGDILSEGPQANLSRAESREAGARVEGSSYLRAPLTHRRPPTF